MSNKREHVLLADKVLGIVGVRRVKGRRVVTTADMRAKEQELLALLGEVRAYYTAVERQRLYKNNEHLGVSVARLALSMAGHPLERLPGGGGFTVD
mmetsp:Transcript_9881/g.29865  ORF Transcript_9881/g.29865 Transcript_9881/m.29865 type:complete len:96 (+) Transcript_9881:1649-1936(+)